MFGITIVVDRPRSRAGKADNLSTNHGGVAVIAVPGTNLSPIDLKVDEPTTFEYVCVRATSGQFSAILLVIYRPGSSAVQLSFFDELSSVFDAVATYQEAVYVAGDVNIRVDCCDDPVTKQFTDLLSCYGFFVQPTTSQSCIKYSTNKYQYQYQYQWSKYQYKYQCLTFKYQYQYKYCA